jgi:hypothetical protein
MLISIFPNTVCWRGCLFSSASFCFKKKKSMAVTLRAYFWVSYSIPLLCKKPLLIASTKSGSSQLLLLISPTSTCLLRCSPHLTEYLLHVVLVPRTWIQFCLMQHCSSGAWNLTDAPCVFIRLSACKDVY